jgi:hypothetical protein
MQIIPAVSGNKTRVNNAEFLKLTIYNDVANTANTTVHTFSSAYSYETIDGTVYTPLGGLLAVGVQQRDLRVTQADTSVSLSGIDGNNIFIVLATKIRGSKLEIFRGFYNDNYVLSNVALRFTGIVTSYQITESLEIENDIDNYVVTVNASSYKTVLENRVAGRKTNSESWKIWNPSDVSMDQVYSLADQQFDFGKTPITKPATTSTAQTENNTAASSDMDQNGGGSAGSP